jgi:peptidoglycan biosynthesis protein MviN/MurJ (putative lipid II flippase)
LGRDENVIEVLRRFVPALTARGVVQLSSFVDLALASFLAAGAVATLGMVTPLYLISIGVFGFSVATSELTEISRSGRLDSAVARRIRIGSRKVLLPSGLVAPILIFGSPIVVDGLYGWLSRLISFSNLNQAGLAVTALTLSAFALGLPASMQARVTQNALFALGDVRGPARISLIRLGIVATVGFVLMLQLDHLAIDTGRSDAATTQAAADYEIRQAELLGSLDVTLEPSDGPDELVELNGFPHWPLWEPLPSVAREGLAESGLAPLGPVGLGLASAVASWAEFMLLRRRLKAGVFTPVESGIVINVAAGSSVVAVLTVAFGLFVSDLPSPLPLLLLGPAALAAYMATLTFLGMGPYARPPKTGSDPSLAGEV